MNTSVVYLVVFLSVAAMVICVASFLYFRAYLKRKTAQKEVLSGIQEEVNRILRAIDETTDRDISLVEEREKNLKSLLDEVDKRLKTYIREMELRKEADDAYEALRQKKSSAPVPPGAEAYQDLGKNRYRGKPPEPQSAENPPAAEAQENSAEVPSSPGPAFPLPNFSVNPETGDTPSPGDKIHDLVRAGFAAPIIASRLGISIAEVEFAAALLERKAAKL